MTPAKSHTVEVHYDRAGQIVAIVDATPRRGVGAGVFPMNDAKSIVVELSPAQRDLSLLALHATHYVDVRGGEPQLRAHNPPGKGSGKPGAARKR
jgi:hypothetical protein